MTSKLFTFLVVSCLLLPLHSHATAQTHEKAKPVLKLHAETSSVYIGEPLLLRITLENQGGQTLVLPHFEWRNALVMTRSQDGNVISSSRLSGWGCYIGSTRSVPVEPGEKRALNLQLTWYDATLKPGKYLLEVALEPVYRDEERQLDAAELPSASLIINIQPATKATDIAALRLIEDSVGEGLPRLFHLWHSPNAEDLATLGRVFNEHSESVYAKHAMMTSLKHDAEWLKDYPSDKRELLDMAAANWPDTAIVDDAHLMLAQLALDHRAITRASTEAYRAMARIHLTYIVEELPESSSATEAARLLGRLESAEREPSPEDQ